jgi:uncharacterized DUF497 family protein
MGTNGRTRTTGLSVTFGLKKAQSVSAIRMRACHDPEHCEEEERFILLGVSSAVRPLVVVHCCRESDSVVRIISARKATKREVRSYQEGI